LENIKESILNGTLGCIEIETYWNDEAEDIGDGDYWEIKLFIICAIFLLSQ
jgi:hypothetical protein